MDLLEVGILAQGADTNSKLNRLRDGGRFVPLRVTVLQKIERLLGGNFYEVSHVQLVNVNDIVNIYSKSFKMKNGTIIHGSQIHRHDDLFTSLEIKEGINEIEKLIVDRK